MPDGLRYHSAESFLEELGNCYRERTDKHEQSNAVKVPPLLFRPFITAIAGTRNSRLRDMVQDEILAKLFAEPAKLEFDFDRLDLAQLINMVGTANAIQFTVSDRIRRSPMVRTPKDGIGSRNRWHGLGRLSVLLNRPNRPK